MFPTSPVYADFHPGPAMRNLDMDPLVPIIKNMLTEINLVEPLQTILDSLDSNALLNVSIVSLKSIPHVHMGGPFVEKFENGLSCRMRYAEAALMSLASLVYQAVSATLFTVLSAVTLGQVDAICNQMRKSWIHTVSAAAALGISAIGTLSPEWGLKANAIGLAGLGFATLQWMQGDVFSQVTESYQTHKNEIKETTLQGLSGDQAFYDRHFVPFFQFLDNHFNPNEIQSLGQMIRFMQKASEICPPVALHVTPEVLGENVLALGESWSSEPVEVSV